MTNNPNANLIEQKITKTVTVNAGTNGSVLINVPSDRNVYMKGYGYSWASDCIYNLIVGNRKFPNRSDQEGSPAQPMIYGVPLPITRGGQFGLLIQNNGASNVDVEVVFYIATDDFLEEVSTGGAIIVATDSGSGTTSNVITLTGSKTALENVETTSGTAIGTSKILPIAGSDGTQYKRVKVDDSGRLDSSPVNTLYPNELIGRTSDTDTGLGNQDFEITLSGLGTNRIVREVYAYFPVLDDGSFVEVYDGNPASGGTKLGEFWVSAQSYILLNKETTFTGNLWLRYQSLNAQTVYFNYRVISD